jgi:hypothetical protein
VIASTYRLRRYVTTAIERETEAVRSAAEGSRAVVLFRAAIALGPLVGAGALDEEEPGDLLLQAALAAGLGRREALGHIRRGLRLGAQRPREMPVERTSLRPTRPAPRRWSEAPAQYPPGDEVAAVWTTALPITHSKAAHAWCRVRGLDPYAIELFDLARVLEPHVALPAWAGRATPWSESSYRLILPAFNHLGEMRSLRARRLEHPVPAGELKVLAPRGFSMRGLVLACPLARRLLAGDVPGWWRREVVVVEGEPDYLAVAGAQSEVDEQGPAVFAIASGSWTPEHAACIPQGARVVLATHADAGGDEYAGRVAETLRGRTVELYRQRPELQP